MAEPIMPQLTQEELQAKHKQWLASQVALGGCPNCGHLSGVLNGTERLCGSCGTKYEVKTKEKKTDGQVSK